MIERVGVIGAGIMGVGIAEVCAKTGADVLVVEANPEALETGRRRLEQSLDRAVTSNRMTQPDRDAAVAKVKFTGDLGTLGDRELVIEAIVESADAKIAVFTALDKVLAGSSAIMASNTSSIPIMRLAMVTSRPDAVVGLHFFNPVPVLRLVEVVPSLLTSPETTALVEEFAGGQLAKVTVRSPDRAGFIVNALLLPYILAAVRMFESGFATAEDIDRGMVEGCAHPMGPLALADLIGLDTVLAVANSLYGEFKEPLYAGPSLLLRMVDAGLLGRKTGHGFFDYQKRAGAA